MNKAFKDWLFKPAKWYQFWRPLSGVGGGTISGLLIVAAWAAYIAFKG